MADKALDGSLGLPGGITRRSVYDPRIDFFRGLALIFIFINHIPNNAMTWVTSRAAGLSDAAEVFMFLGGYSAALAYAKLAPHGIQPMAEKALKRVLVLLCYHCGLVAALMVSAYIINREFGIITGYEIFLDRIESRPLKTLLATPLLAFQAPLLDILPVYIIVLLAAPFMVWLVARSPMTLLILSGLVWMFAGRFFPLVPTVTYDIYWAFNPFCWQLMFAIGLVCGWYGRHGELPIASPETRRLLDLAASSFTLFGLGVMMSVSNPHWVGPVTEHMRLLYWGLNKQCLDIWRIADFLTSAYLAARFIPKMAPWFSWRPVSWVCAMGAVSLPVFAISTMLSFYGKFITEAYGSSVNADIAVSLAGVTIMILVTIALTRKSTAAHPGAVPGETGKP